MVAHGRSNDEPAAKTKIHPHYAQLKHVAPTVLECGGLTPLFKPPESFFIRRKNPKARQAAALEMAYLNDRAN
jgi:hypothetical protein